MASAKPRRESRSKAAKAGRRRYLSAGPCSGCGGIERYTVNGNCVPCSKAAAQKQREEIRRLLHQAEEE